VTLVTCEEQQKKLHLPTKKKGEKFGNVKIFLYIIVNKKKLRGGKRE
jgi:hypothetical protein